MCMLLCEIFVCIALFLLFVLGFSLFLFFLNKFLVLGIIGGFVFWFGGSLPSFSLFYYFLILIIFFILITLFYFIFSSFLFSPFSSEPCG